MGQILYVVIVIPNVKGPTAVLVWVPYARDGPHVEIARRHRGVSDRAEGGSLATALDDPQDFNACINSEVGVQREGVSGGGAGINILIRERVREVPLGVGSALLI